MLTWAIMWAMVNSSHESSLPGELLLLVIIGDVAMVIGVVFIIMQGIKAIKKENK